MSLTLHCAPRTDHLADALGELLAVPLPDPFAQEVIVVPEKGVERWLAQRLSHRLGSGERGGDGVCAGVRFLRPYSIVSLLLDRDREDPWQPDRLVWPLLAAIDDALDEPWAATLARHLGHGLGGDDEALRRNRRYAVALRLARLFGSYAVQRPTLIADWSAGRDTDGAGRPLPGDLAWQAELWRRLVPKVSAPTPAQRHATALAGLRDGGATLDLPDRLSLFGHTRMPVTEVELLHALGERRDVHLWLPQPSQALWDALAGVDGVVARDEDQSAALVGHPLLAALGRDARELRRTLGGMATSTGSVRRSTLRQAQDRPSSTSDRSDSMLGWLQSDLRANAAPSPDLRATRQLSPDDRSLQIHACHGPARQIEVLREVLVGLLEDDPTLEPRDILVMCPDVESFAPLISAGFGLAGVVEDAAGGGHPAHRLRVRLADRALASTNPLLALAARLIELNGGRLTASDVLDLASDEPVRLRFGFTDDDLERIRRWVTESGVRWGLDGPHRAAFAMDKFEHNTWRAGLDRLLLGAALSGDDHRHLGRGLPVDDVGSGEVELAGRFAEYAERLAATMTALDQASGVSDWMTALRDGTRALTDVSLDDAWQLPQFERELARAGTASSDAVELRLADIRALLKARLAGKPTRANFRTGTLTVCTMTPMRSVPHRVVCLVGLDDGVFPRRDVIDGDDCLARHPLTGERDPRSEDRQLLLDAILAATETLVITYTGANETTGASRPPAVPLGEILDAADRTASAPVRDQIRTLHPLQPYDPRNLEPGALISDASFSFDHAALAGAQAIISERSPVPAFLPTPLAPTTPTDVSLEELKAFFLHPVRTFLRERLGVSTPYTRDELSEAIPIELNGLEKWDIGNRLLTQVLAGQDPTAVMTAEHLRGSLPPFGLGELAIEGVVKECQQLFARTADLRVGEARSIDVDVDLGNGRRVTGTVNSIYANKIVSLSYSRVKPKARLVGWIDLLALSAARPDESWTSHVVGKERAGPRRALAGPLDHRAQEWLADLVQLRDEGLTRPLPLPVETANAWAEGHARSLLGDDIDPMFKAAKAWETDPHNEWGITGEDDDAWHRRAYGNKPALSQLVGLTDYAWRLWEPLLTGGERVAPL